LRRKGDRIRLRIAQHLRAHCSATIRWIAEGLHSGTVAYWAKRESKTRKKGRFALGSASPHIQNAELNTMIPMSDYRFRRIPCG
jgi:hypothetical protein